MQQMSSCDYCSGVDNETRSARLVILGRVFELDDDPPHCRVRIPFGRVGNNLRSRTSGELSFIKEPLLTVRTQLAAHLCFIISQKLFIYDHQTRPYVIKETLLIYMNQVEVQD